MLPDVQVLLDIQELDKEALELNGQLAKYPVIWEEVKTKLAKKKAAVEQAIEEREKHVRERRKVEQKIRLFSDDMRRFQSQQATVKTAKEYEAINKQMEQVKVKISQLEEQGLQLIARDEQVELDIKTAEEELKKVEALYATEKERIRVQFNDKKNRVAKLESEKKQQIARVSGEMYTIYERINRRHPGSAIVVVRSGSCTGCHFGLLPNVLVDVHRGEKAVSCPNCGRMLSVDESFVPAEAAASS